MKKLIYLILILSLLVYCRQKQAEIETIMEDGVEVIINHIEPYEVKGEPSTFALEKEFVIDMERDDLAGLGITEIESFDIDSEGNVYLVDSKGVENFIFKFGRNGNFIGAFAHKGQGPGELQRPSTLKITSLEEIAITDTANNRLSIFGKDGKLIKEMTIDSNIRAMVPLDNGKYLVRMRIVDPSAEYLAQSPLSLYSSEFEEIKELDLQKIPNPIVGKRLKGTYHIFSWSISNRRIYTGYQERGYDIYVYDLEGNLLRKIKKEYKRIPVPDEYKRKYMEQFDAPIFEPIKGKIYFPGSMPAFHSFFVDDEGRLFVMTYEKGKNAGEYIYDIFNDDGVFIGRKSLKIHHDPNGLYAKMKKGHLYCINEKESGYKKLVAYKMKWEE
jgi:hypothetical protein